MCIIMRKPAGIEMPAMEAFERMLEANPDGAGFMWMEGMGIRYQKGLMDFRSVENFIKKLSGEIDIKNTDLAFHARIATHGKVAAGYTHPYPVCDDIDAMLSLEGFASAMVMHNGIIGGFGDKAGVKGSMSDTMEFIKEVIYPTLALPNIKNMYERLTQGSKLLIFSNGEAAMTGKWTLDEGVYFSNDSYKLKVVKEDWDWAWSHWKKGKCLWCKRYDWLEDGICDKCATQLSYPDDDGCDFCGKKEWVFEDECGERYCDYCMKEYYY